MCDLLDENGWFINPSNEYNDPRNDLPDDFPIAYCKICECELEAEEDEICTTCENQL